MDQREQETRLLDGALFGVLVMSSLVFYWVATRGTWNPLYEAQNSTTPLYFDKAHFFLAQAQALTHGRLWVQPSTLPGECWIRAQKCYGYFGLTPSILRLPLLPVLDHYKRGLTPVYLTAALTLATGSFLASLRRLLTDVLLARSTTILVCITALGFGAASVLTQLTPNSFYDEAIAWSVGFLSLSVYCVIRWWENQRLVWYALLLVSLVLAANARPTAVPFALIVGLGTGYRIWSTRTDGTPHRSRALWLSGALIALPMVTCLGVFYIKFRQPIPSQLLNQEIGGPLAIPAWLAVRSVDHNQLVSWRFIPTAMFAYLRPDGLTFNRVFPWVTFRFLGYYGNQVVTWLWLPPGALETEPVSSLSAAMPLSFLAFASAFVIAVTSRMRRSYDRKSQRLRALVTLEPGRRWSIVLLAAVVASWFVVLTGVDISNRYLGDAYPMLALLLLLALPRLARAVERSGRLVTGTVATLVVCGIGWQLLVNIGLGWRNAVG